MRLGELQVGKWFRDERAAACATEEAGVAYVRRVFGWLSEQPAWRAAAHRHVFVWSQDKGAYRIAEHDPALFAELRRGVFVQVAGAFMPGRPLAFEPSWDVVIPPQSDRPIVPIPASAADARARQRTVFWQGAAAYAHSTYPARVAFVREYGAGQWPKVKLRIGQGGSASDRESAARGLTNATFCLFLSGHSPQRWSGSLGHMLASGCLLIFADDVSTLPLGETLPWESMSLQVPEATPAALSRLVDARPTRSIVCRRSPLLPSLLCSAAATLRRCSSTLRCRETTSAESAATCSGENKRGEWERDMEGKGEMRDEGGEEGR
jgi:hypothetical protein